VFITHSAHVFMADYSPLVHAAGREVSGEHLFKLEDQVCAWHLQSVPAFCQYCCALVIYLIFVVFCIIFYCDFAVYFSI